MRNIVFYVPGTRYYDNGLYQNHANSFVNISLTGAACECRCEHCQGKLLNSMISVTEPEKLVELAKNLRKQGCQGVLISGGACADGSVPLRPFAKAIEQVAALGLAVVVHPGVLSDDTAHLLAGANITRVALDLIGDDDTIRNVYHLPYTSADYQISLRTARHAGLKTSPHIVIGLHYGEIRGEFKALDMVAAEGADSLILVLLNPLKNTPMSNVTFPPLYAVREIFRQARKLLPDIPIALGCARPPGHYSRSVELLAIDAGFNAIAYPARETVDYASSCGYKIAYQEMCCGIF
ncbi:radical SAM protein [Sporomusa acidovorans]|uniref:Radical SAM core domain-containing protein n=1 Tax=Sporomusa acidovorans (strain ATCC 49682 / DSM 3132 / Mol) TaxID=1123286 RepID=A0ABZ3J5S8_SPOA4|nr:radical SAM protein [Sporomusa acidovorans]OZC15638.1 biotin synthase [Sporomusa acidovorans DSM 3132]SDE87970.1 hypothetical protein SAMN04488499_102510 [Sporomusa acidovorans]